MPVFMLCLLILGFAALGAPVVVLLAPTPMILLCVGIVRKDLRHVLEHGLGDSGDGSGGEGRGGLPAPVSPLGPSDGEQFDWDAFVVQFWDHVEREPAAELEPVA